jgi:hypothetical protein
VLESAMEINLGDRAVEELKHDQGIVVARVEFAYKCVLFQLQPERTKDGVPLDAHWYDKGGCTFVSKALQPRPENLVAPTWPLKSIVRDRITHVKGVATAITYHLYGPPTVTIELPIRPDGTHPQAQAFPVEQLELVRRYAEPVKEIVRPLPVATGGVLDRFESARPVGATRIVHPASFASIRG